MTTARGAGHPASHSSKTEPHEPARKSGYEKWQDGIDDANANWDVHDCEIRSSVDEYNRHLGRSPGYVPLDWKIVKIMLWVETGAKDPLWKSRPMQIGNARDPGLTSLLFGNEGGALIIPPSIRRGLSLDGVRSDPKQNIRAGIGYLLMRMASYAYKSVLNADATVHEVTAMAGDNIARVAKAQGSTPEVMKKLNPSVGIVHAGDVLKYQKASVERVITGWNPLSSGSIAQRYNHGDPLYAKKFQYAASSIARRVEASCAR
jgi:hypothetical protein